MPDPGMFQHGGCCGPHVGLLLQAGPHKVLPFGRMPRREVHLVAVHDQRGCLDLHSIYNWHCRLLAIVLRTETGKGMTTLRLRMLGILKVTAAVLHTLTKLGHYTQSVSLGVHAQETQCCVDHGRQEMPTLPTTLTVHSTAHRPRP